MCMVEWSLWTRFLEVSVEDICQTAYIDAHTTKFIFLSCFLRSLFVCLETSEKIPVNGCSFMKGSLTRDIPSIGDAGQLAAFALLAPASYH